jgi:TPR repeat protein
LDEARRLYRLGAEQFNVIAFANLASVAGRGFFHFDAEFPFSEVLQESQRRPSDLEEAFRLLREAARLGHTPSCVGLSHCYSNGQGTEQDFANAFKWTKKAAENGFAKSMAYCAYCYHIGQGVDQCNEQAIYWYEKSLELKENEGVRRNLQTLRVLPGGSSLATGPSQESQPT